jgi:uncharacterized RDD family membrane protein YckC
MICRNHVDVSEGVRRCSRCGATFCRNCLVEIQGRPYCATCKTEQLLDVQSGVDRTALDYAGIGQRFAAQFVDGLVTGVPTFILVMVMLFSTISTGAKRPPTFNPFVNFWFFLPVVAAVIYEALFLARRGQTLGKMALKVKVVRQDGTAISAGQAWGRAVTRAVLGVFYLLIIDYLAAFFTKEKTTLHDMIARTRVVNWV